GVRPPSVGARRPRRTRREGYSRYIFLVDCRRAHAGRGAAAVALARSLLKKDRALAGGGERTPRSPGWRAGRAGAMTGRDQRRPALLGAACSLFPRGRLPHVAPEGPFPPTGAGPPRGGRPPPPTRSRRSWRGWGGGAPPGSFRPAGRCPAAPDRASSHSVRLR